MDINNIDDEEQSSLIDFLKSDDNTEEQLVKEELQVTVQKAMNVLKDNYKTVLMLRDIEDYSYEEIAEILNVSTEVVKVWIFRARTRLKEILLKGGNL